MESYLSVQLLENKSPRSGAYCAPQFRLFPLKHKRGVLHLPLTIYIRDITTSRLCTEHSLTVLPSLFIFPPSSSSNAFYEHSAAESTPECALVRSPLGNWLGPSTLESFHEYYLAARVTPSGGPKKRKKFVVFSE